MTKKLNDLIDPKIKFVLMESSDEVDGTNILAKVKGQFFCPDGKSRNGRFYPKELWERVIQNENVQRLLKKRLMFGTVGHDAELGEKAIREGLTSHIMTKIFIDEKNQGIGEALILNTPVGKVLNTLLRAGCELYVSSRANGDFSGKREGLPVVNPETYDLVGWDFVIDPGFLEANPVLAESLTKAIKETEDDSEENNRGDKMEETLVKHITDENASLKNKVSALSEEIVTLKESNTAIFDENKHLKEQLSAFEETSAKLKKYEEMGEPEEVEKAMDLGDQAADELEKYKSMGSAEEVKENLSKAVKYIGKIHEEIGTYKEIKKALTEAKVFQDTVNAIGTISEIKGVFARFGKLLEEVEAGEADKMASDLAQELGIELEKVKELLAKGISVEDIKAMFSVVSEKFKKDESKADKKVDKKIVENKNDKYKKVNEECEDEEEDEEEEEVKSESKVIGKTLVERLNETYARK